MRIGEKIKSFDLFSQGVGFEIAGSGGLQSFLGAILSFMIVFVTIFYAYGRFDVLYQRGDTMYQSVLE